MSKLAIANTESARVRVIPFMLICLVFSLISVVASNSFSPETPARTFASYSKGIEVWAETSLELSLHENGSLLVILLLDNGSYLPGRSLDVYTNRTLFYSDITREEGLLITPPLDQGFHRLKIVFHGENESYLGPTSLVQNLSVSTTGGNLTVNASNTPQTNKSSPQIPKETAGGVEHPQSQTNYITAKTDKQAYSINDTIALSGDLIVNGSQADLPVFIKLSFNETAVLSAITLSSNGTYSYLIEAAIAFENEGDYLFEVSSQNVSSSTWIYFINGETNKSTEFDNENITNLTNFSVSPAFDMSYGEAVQDEAIIGESVLWSQPFNITHLGGEQLVVDISLDLPIDASDIIVSDGKTVLANSPELVVNLRPNETIHCEVTYETPAPQKKEDDVNGSKLIEIYSEASVPYHDVLIYTGLPSLSYEPVVYRISKGEREVIDSGSFGLSYLDLDLDGSYDRLEWVLPRLSHSKETWFIEFQTKTIMFSLEIRDAKGNPIPSTIILSSKDKVVKEKNSNVIELEEGTYDMEIEPKNHRVKKITLENIQLKSDLDAFIGLDEMPNEGIFIGPYAIDTSELQFWWGSVTSTARGHALYSCKGWNFKEQRCDSYWGKIKEIKPGEEYTSLLMPGVTGYGVVLETRALHLDENKTVIGDVYDEVGDKDGTWKQIPAGQYIRMTFEKNLTSEDDVTIYARSDSPCSIEVYEKYGTEKIAEFENIQEDKKYKVLLTNLEGNHDTFDLRIIDGPVDLDYVFDIAPVVNLEFPNDDSGDNDGVLIFEYAVVDDSDIANCSLLINGEINQSSPSIPKRQTSNFTLKGLPVASYNWSVNCTDEYGRESSSETRSFDIVLTTTFSGGTNDLSQVNTSNITNFTVEDTDKGKISFTDSLNLNGGADLDSVIEISHNSISVDTTEEPRLNKSATLTFYNLKYAHTPIILRDHEICSDCLIESYEDGELTFIVSHFTNYTSGANSNLTIWDETDPKGGSEVKFVDDNITFYANFTNSTSGNPINGTTYCEIGFDGQLNNMTYNATSQLYEYNRSFSSYGTFDWNVSCNGSSQGYEVLNLTDTVLVSYIDLTVKDISFNDSTPVESEAIKVTANVSNLGDANATNTTIELNISLWNGSVWVFDSTQEQNETDIENGSSILVNFTWTAKPGTYLFNVTVDPDADISESNETNNNNSTNYTVGSWNVFYGSVGGDILIADSNSNNFTVWSVPVTVDGNLYAADVDSSIVFADLEPLNGTDDLSEADSALNMTGFSDSIKSLYDADDNDVPDSTDTFVVWGRTVNNVPIVNSTNNDNFITGILWDSSDGGSQYNGTQDLVFMTEINGNQTGAYGTYDYELKVPSKLKEWAAGSDLITIYVELR